ncbi:MAG: hypothetical protein C5B51_28995 [Terriglobia bacterium]|nr:MAG: hypothetical protein C5B51_28995 [Terriglobia bacterium]
MLAVAVSGVLLAAMPAFAHHSFAAEYDANKPITLKGTVAKVEFLNPHVWIYIDAKNDAGQVTRWQCEGGAPNSLRRQGWTQNSLKVGDSVMIEGFLAKDATNTCNSRSIKLPDGRRVFAGSAEDGGPNAKGAKPE